MIVLSSTTHSLEVETSAAESLDYYVAYAIHGASFAAEMASGNIATAATTTVVAAPAAATQYVIKAVSLVNRGTANQNVRAKLDVSGTERFLTPNVSLKPGESYCYDDNAGWRVLDTAGRVKIAPTDNQGITGRHISLLKVGTAPEAAGQLYCFSKDTGFPGAWSPGAPGLNGRVTDGMSAGDAGCIPLWTPTGSLFLTRYDPVANINSFQLLLDFLWVNTGLVVTTTTAQAITPVALPSRDANGSTNGEGVHAALLVLTATTNAAAITNCTINYTNSNGVAGRTATMASFPATAVIGTLVRFQLAAGDKGIRSVQSVTLGTSLAAGAVSLVLFRQVQSRPMASANTGTPDVQTQVPGVRLYNGSCLLPVALVSTTTAITLQAGIEIMER